MNENRKTALIVDDDNFTLESQKDFLRLLAGFEITTAPSREEALKYKDQEFDLLLLDGLEGDCMRLYPEIKASRKVIITGDNEIYEEARKKELEVYLKPFYLGDLLKND